MPDSQHNQVQPVAGGALNGSEPLSEKRASLENLPTGYQQLGAATIAKDELLELCSTLTEKADYLEAALAKAHRYAHYDELTGLPNRRLLLDRFIQASNLATRNSQLLALLFFDLNDFKGVNDELGHDAGDKLLQQVATRLTSVIRKSDTACRYGGDEFVVLLTEIGSRERAVTKLNKIRAYLAPPYDVDHFSIRLTVSIGLSIYPNDADSITELLQTSDRLMFRNKTASRDRSGGTSQLTILPR